QRRLSRWPPVTLLDIFQQRVASQPGKLMLRFGYQDFTYKEMDRRSNQASRVFSQQLALRPGQVVAVLLPNGPSYVWTWLALAKLGCPMACLNVNIKGRLLLHAVATAGATVVLASAGEWGVTG
ncbi:S27A2 synthetase, partial [Rhinopomastus cyanomelas]|nr:S27A2 synthetase [Rhinopomastus cyanomelas]